MEITSETVKTTIEKYLNTEIAPSDQNFFQQGILDSFDAMNLIITLEEKFGVKLEFLDFADNNHFKLDYIVKKIQAAQN